MRNFVLNPISKKKCVFLIIMMITLFLLFFLSLIGLVIKYSTILAIIMIVSYFGCLAFVFITNVYVNNYKWKYVFLGKNFKNQKNDFFNKYTHFSKNKKKSIIKEMKDTYRTTGDILNIIEQYTQTPNKLCRNVNGYFSYLNSNDEIKINYIIHSLQCSSSFDDAIMCFFEYIAYSQFEYHDYYRLLKDYNLFSERLTNILIDNKYEILFKLHQNNHWTKADEEIFEKFKQEKMDSLSEFTDEINLIANNQVIKFFLKQKALKNLPQNTSRVFISPDGMQRICIYKDKKTNVFKVCKSNFMFFDNENIADSDGKWIDVFSSSIYKTEDLALNELNNEIKDYICKK